MRLDPWRGEGYSGRTGGMTSSLESLIDSGTHVSRPRLREPASYNAEIYFHYRIRF